MNTRQILPFTLLLALASAIASGSPATLPANRTLTDISGRKLEVTILSKAYDSLHVRRASDGEEFDIQISKLSPDDQTFARDLQNRPAETKPERQDTNKPPRQSEPPSPSQKSEMPNRLLVAIPPLETQLAELSAIADQFAADPKRTRDTETLRDRIAKAKNDNSDALADLSWLIREIRCTRGLPDGARRSFDILRLALVHPTPKAISCLMLSYGLHDSIPPEFADECYVITKREADNGNIEAMIALGSCWINGHGRSPLATPDAGGRTSTGIAWLEKALLANPSDGQKAAINGLLAKAYKYNNQPEKALPLLTEGANHGDPYLMNHLADLYYQGKGCERDLKTAVEWYEKAAAKGVRSSQLDAAKTELEYSREITDSQGRKIAVIILSKTATTIRVRRASDNKEFDLPLATLTDDDRKFVANLKEPPPIPFQGKNGLYDVNFGKYFLIRIKGKTYGIRLEGIPSAVPNKFPNDTCYYAIKYQVWERATGPWRSVSTGTCDEKIDEHFDNIEWKGNKIDWISTGKYICRVSLFIRNEAHRPPAGSDAARIPQGFPEGTEYYNEQISDLNQPLKDDGWTPIP